MYGGYEKYNEIYNTANYQLDWEKNLLAILPNNVIH